MALEQKQAKQNQTFNSLFQDLGVPGNQEHEKKLAALKELWQRVCLWEMETKKDKNFSSITNIFISFIGRQSFVSGGDAANPQLVALGNQMISWANILYENRKDKVNARLLIGGLFLAAIFTPVLWVFLGPVAGVFALTLTIFYIIGALFIKAELVGEPAVDPKKLPHALKGIDLSIENRFKLLGLENVLGEIWEFDDQRGRVSGSDVGSSFPTPNPAALGNYQEFGEQLGKMSADGKVQTKPDNLTHSQLSDKYGLQAKNKTQSTEKTALLDKDKQQDSSKSGGPDQ